MTPEKQKEAFKFMFACFDDSTFWNPGGLTKAGNPQGNPPDLNAVEAESVFRFLVERGLIFTTVNQHNQPCFLINVTKKKEWEDLIDPPNFC